MWLGARHRRQPALLDERGIAVPAEFDGSAEAARCHDRLRRRADGNVLGAIAVADPLRATAREAIELLRSHGIRRVVMLTGDHAGDGRAVAAERRRGRGHCGPAAGREARAIEVARERRTAPVLMVGDGINDAPALAAADVGDRDGCRGV